MEKKNTKVGIMLTINKSTRAAIDLASIMVGILVVGIIAGVVAATIFAVIPWAQDNAAKANLDAVATAQNAHKGFSAENGGFPYADYDTLVGNRLVTRSEKVNASVGNDAKCYLAVSQSDSGKFFYNSSENSKPEEVTPDTVSNCVDITTLVPTDTPPAPVLAWNKMETSGSATLVLDTTGHLWGWGTGYEGVLGTGTQTTYRYAIAITPNVTYKEVSISNTTTLALDTSGHLWAFGGGYWGTVGNGTDVRQLSPVAITPSKTYSKIYTRAEFSIAIDTDGKMWGWGRNETSALTGYSERQLTPKAINPSKTYKEAALGYSHVTALDTDGHLWSWGENGSGQLGDGTQNTRQQAVAVTPSKTYKSIAANGYTTYAIDSNDKLWEWGTIVGPTEEDFGTNLLVPTAVTPSVSYKKISAGVSHLLALDTTGHLWTQGAGVNGELGNGINQHSPTLNMITPTLTYKDISAGGAASRALTTDGKMYAWGAGDYGYTFYISSATPVLINGLSF